MQLQYNSPVILTFFLLSLGALFLGQWTGGWTTKHLFCVYRGSLKDPLFYIRLFGHVLGHASWDHFLNNMLLLLVIGPPMEEKYGSGPLLKGILLTALISGVLQCVLFPHTALLGASGIVFMLIMLASLSGFSGGIPVTMLLVAALYLGQQVYDIIFARDNVANFMHIVGGVCGTAFGYVYAMLPRKRRRPAARKKLAPQLITHGTFDAIGNANRCIGFKPHALIRVVPVNRTEKTYHALLNEIAAAHRTPSDIARGNALNSRCKR